MKTSQKQKMQEIDKKINLWGSKLCIVKIVEQM